MKRKKGVNVDSFTSVHSLIFIYTKYYYVSMLYNLKYILLSTIAQKVNQAFESHDEPHLQANIYLQYLLKASDLDYWAYTVLPILSINQMLLPAKMCLYIIKMYISLVIYLPAFKTSFFNNCRLYNLF